MVALRFRSYRGQPVFPMVAKDTPAACMVTASSFSGSAPSSGPIRGKVGVHDVEEERDLQSVDGAKMSTESR
jgi:hypothetical protein